MRRKNKDSEEASDSEYNSSDSDEVDSSTTAKKVTPKRKRGRKPAARNKRQKTQDDSEDDSSPHPSTSNNVNVQSSEQEESEDETGSDASFVAPTPKKVATPKRLRGRPPLARNQKQQQLQNGSDKPASPQPSTSRNSRVQVNESESESSSESADSDYGPVRDKSPARKKPSSTQKRRGRPRAASSPKKKAYHSVNGVSPQKVRVNGSNLNASQRKNARASQSNDVSFDLKVVENLAQKLVYFLLIEDQKKYAIRRKAIVTQVFKDEAYTPKLYSSVIKKANIILKKTYGMELMELENQKDSYLIVNILRRELGIHDYVELPRIKQQQHGLILYLLCVIYMNENVISEDELTRCLKPLGIDLTSKRLHPVFGDVKKYITTELVKQMYLNYECISKEPPKYEFTWGLRAKQEFDKRDLLQFVCQIMDDTSPEDWRIQFKDAETSAKPNADS